MFEGQPQAELDALMQSHPEFRQLYQRHRDLDKRVLDAELGVLAVDDSTLSQMKREKLYAKDRLADMLLDEWLGAGDVQFIRKARARMNDKVDGSRIVVLATHNLEIARRVCNKAVVLHRGRVEYAGGVIESILEYKKMCRVDAA